jgi:hypothetical protein
VLRDGDEVLEEENLFAKDSTERVLVVCAEVELCEGVEDFGEENL